MNDVIVVGGSYAGLSAAMQLARARRNVLVIDAGERRNRFAAHAHGILGHDGQSPASIAAKGRAEVLAYPSVRWIDARVTRARAIDGGFVVTANEEEHRAKRLILATGVVDEFPDIPGVRERWGKTVHHCPYCDGYERDRGKLGVLAQGQVASHYGPLVAEWSSETTLFLNGGEGPEMPPHVRVERGPIREVRDAKMGIEIVMHDGRTYELAGLFLAPHTHLPGPFVDDLGIAIETTPIGSLYKTDAITKETSVRHVFACGDVALGQSSVAFAIADGMRAGVGTHRSLVFE